MASLILKMSVSLDGYVASLDGTPDWVAAGRSFRLHELGGRDREQRRRTGVRCSSVDRFAVERRCLARLGGSRIVRVQIRLERDGDEAAVRQVLVRAFWDGEHGAVVAELGDGLAAFVTDGDGLLLVAEQGGEIVGNLMFRVPACWMRLAGSWTSRCSAMSGCFLNIGDKGSAPRLIRTGLTTMIERDVPVVFLGGDLGYYSRFGLRPGAQGFRRPSLRIANVGFRQSGWRRMSRG